MATPTAVDVVMPQMGVSVSEGTITKWLKQEGEEIQADEPLLEISTDKVDTEVPSPGSGVVQEILVQEGETVDVGTRLAVIGPEGGAPAEAPPAPAEEEAPPEPATQAAADESMAAASEGVGDVAPAASQEEAAPPPAPAPPQQPAAQPSGDGRTFVSPVVARIAAEHGVDPGQVPGTGAGGRVTKKDILGFIESGGEAAPAAPPKEEPAAAVEAPAETAAPAAAPAAPTPAKPAAAPAAEAEAAPGETLEPMTAMRRGIAEHMRRSLDTSAHVTSAIEVDMSKIVAVRERLKKEYQTAYGVNPTYLIFVARA